MIVYFFFCSERCQDAEASRNSEEVYTANTSLVADKSLSLVPLCLLEQAGLPVQAGHTGSDVDDFLVTMGQLCSSTQRFIVPGCNGVFQRALERGRG